MIYMSEKEPVPDTARRATNPAVSAAAAVAQQAAQHQAAKLQSALRVLDATRFVKQQEQLLATLATAASPVSSVMKTAAQLESLGTRAQTVRGVAEAAKAFEKNRSRIAEAAQISRAAYKPPRLDLVNIPPAPGVVTNELLTQILDAWEQEREETRARLEDERRARQRADERAETAEKYNRRMVWISVGGLIVGVASAIVTVVAAIITG